MGEAVLRVVRIETRGDRRHAKASDRLCLCAKEARLVVVDGVFVTNCAHELLCSTKVVARQPWKEMVFYLKLKADVQPVEDGWCEDVHRRVKLGDVPFIARVIVTVPVVCVHRPVRYGDLHMQQSGCCMRNQHPADRFCPRGQCEHERGDPNTEDQEGGGLCPSIN